MINNFTNINTEGNRNYSIFKLIQGYVRMMFGDDIGKVVEDTKRNTDINIITKIVEYMVKINKTIINYYKEGFAYNNYE